MAVSDVLALVSIFAAIFVFARLGRKTAVLGIANKVAFGLLILFVLYYFFSPEVKKFIQETVASQKKPDDLEKERGKVIQEIEESLRKRLKGR